jgi:DNA-binding PucR family transcriptional regulator
VAPGADPPAPASTRSTITDAINRIGQAPVGWACEIGHAMACHIIEEIPEFGGGIGPFETLRMCTESAVIGCLLQFAGFIPAAAPASTDEALAGVAEFVQRDIGLDLVLRALRLGHALMARAFLAACNDLLGTAARVTEMQYVSEEMFGYIDRFSGALAATYNAERDRWMSSSAATQREVVRQILRGQPIDLALIQKTLNYDFDRQHTAVTLWYKSPLHRMDPSELHSAATKVLDNLGAIQKLIVPAGAGLLWAWGNRRQFNSDIDLDGVSPEHPDVSLAIGTSASGLAGFRRSHSEALAAERVAKLSKSTAASWATAYTDAAVAAMLTGELDTARHFVRRELGPLAADTPNAADLRATLLCYFDEESSPFAAARRLHVSRNTVGYRVKRACDLLGYDIATRRYPLHTALLLAARFGSAVLSDDTINAAPANPHPIRSTPVLA